MSVSDFPIEEYRGRIFRIRQKMSAQGMAAVILLNPENIHYATGYECSWGAGVGEFSCVIIPLEGDARLLVRVADCKSARNSWVTESHLYVDWTGPWDILKSIFADIKAASSTIGLEEGYIPFAKYKKLKSLFPDASFVDAAAVVRSVMSCPSPQEIDFTRRAGVITQAGLDRSIEKIGEGVACYEVIDTATEAMYKAGMTEQLLFGKYMLACVWAGPEGGAVNETDVTRTITRGDIVTSEPWGTFKHYVCGAMASVYVGSNPPADVRDAYKVLAEMYLAARETMKPGKKVSDVWHAANKVYKSAYGHDHFRQIGSQHGAGHPSRLDPNNADVLAKGATFFIQAQVNDPLFLCVCATVMVTDTGYEEVTRPLLELIIV